MALARVGSPMLGCQSLMGHCLVAVFHNLQQVSALRVSGLGEQEVIEFIKQLKQICLAPIFILSAFDKDWILSKLRDAGIATGEKSYVFVESKAVLCETSGKLISAIEEWIADSPHVYLDKC
jgi:hypothetical protein